MRRSYRIDLGAGVDGLTLAEERVPELEPDQVLVRVHATSLSSRDLMIANGWYPLPVKRQVIPVADGAGEVVAVGDAVSRVAIGDRVIASLFPEWLDGRWSLDVSAQLGGSHDGLLTDFAVIGQHALVLMPEHLSFEEAACLPCAAATAWNSLTGGRTLSPNDVVLTLGSGSVSLLSIQLAKAAGARVFATTTTDEKARQLSRLGADAVMKRTDPNWPDQVLEATEGHGADRIVETSGQLEPAVRALAIEGEIAFVGLLERERLRPLSPLALWTKGLTLRAIIAGSRAHLAAATASFATHLLRPAISRVFPFTEAREAYHYYESTNPFGKVVIAHNVGGEQQ